MNAFKLDLMTLLAVFVILAVIVTMTFGAKDVGSTSANTFNQPKSTIGTPGGVAPVSSSSFRYRESQAVIPASRYASRSWN
ncbi:MAG: hypothetical protein L0Z73_02550 [Gammaproteobacteria bacterium]|nr:hypothetical protein [Gammaproteobacteria bacterium]